MAHSSSAEYYDPHGLVAPVDRPPPQTGCRALVAALLEDVFLCRDTRSTSRRVFNQWQRDAGWVASDAERPFSFLWCCHMLGLDPQTVRRDYVSDHYTERSLPAHSC
jgi:hypothetical protein